MPSEPMRVEVVCSACGGTGETEGYPGYAPQGGPDGARYTCWGCNGERHITATLAPGSLAEAMIELALATMRLYEVGYSIAELEDPERTCERYEAALFRYGRANDAVRNHPDYKGGTDGD